MTEAERDGREGWQRGMVERAEDDRGRGGQRGGRGPENGRGWAERMAENGRGWQRRRSGPLSELEESF